MTLPPHYTLIAEKIPAWMKAAPDTHQTLRHSLRTPLPWFENACLTNPAICRELQPAYARHREAESRWRTLLAPLPGLEDFARPRLVDALKTRFGLTIDVDHTYLFNARLAAAYRLRSNDARDSMATAQAALKMATQPLLKCALQNFEAAQAREGGLDEGDLKAQILDSDRYLAFMPQGKPVAIEPSAFAALVRELDLGGQYQQCIRNLFNPPARPLGGETAASVMAAAKGAEHHAFVLQTHLALLKGDIDATWHRALNALPGSTDDTLTCSFLKLWDVELTSILIIGPSRQGASQSVPIVAYIPDDPVSPLKVYASSKAFADALRDRLLDRDYLAFFQRFIPARSSQALNTHLENRLRPWTQPPGQAWQERQPNPAAQLHLRESPLLQPMLTQLANQKARRLQDDALFHAVPTAVRDEQSFEHLLAFFGQGALQALNIAAFFVPALGAAMLGVAAVQLGYEVYEGIESWTRDERDQALTYLMDVVENVALMAGLAAAGGGGAIPAVERIPVEAPSFIEDLGPVEMPDASIRLWKPDLAPFAHDIVLPAGLQPDASGLYTYQGKTWLALEDRWYLLDATQAADQFTLAHPTRAESYKPLIRHNGAGAWLHGLDKPREWSGITLFRRLGPLGATLDEATAARVLEITDTSEAVLRRTLADQLRPPAQLQDTLWRLKLDAAIPAELSPAERRLRFERAFEALQATDDSDAALLRRVYPDLPFTLRDEVLHGATPGERAQLAQGKVPARLAEEIRAYLLQLRLSRAGEGLLIPAASNADTDRLVLRIMTRLPGWSAQVRIEVRANGSRGSLIDSIGPQDAQIIRILARHADGYSALEADGRELHGVDNLFAALAHALPDAQRNALGVPGAWDGERLRDLVRQAPLPPRQDIREALGLPAVTPGYVPPMRLAGGRLGYLLSGRGAMSGYILRETLLDSLRMLGFQDHVPVSVERILQALEETGMTRHQINARFQQLVDERQRLDLAMSQWNAISATLADPEARASSRSHIGRAIWQHWYSNCLPEITWMRLPLRLEQAFIDDFPATLPEFIYQRTRSLQLIDMNLAPSPSLASDWAQAQALLARFANVVDLEISRPAFMIHRYSIFAMALIQIPTQFPALTRLSFVNQGAMILTADLNRLGTLGQLRHLDLSGNALAWTAGAPGPGMTLDYLGLDRMGFYSWPSWLDANALDTIAEVSLRNNSLIELPRFLLDNAEPAAHQTRVALGGNSLLASVGQQIQLNPDGPNHRFTFNLGVQRGSFGVLEQHLRGRDELREVLSHWVDTASDTASPFDTNLAGRLAINRMLVEYWDRLPAGAAREPLALTDVALAHFPPQLPASFTAEVRSLTLTRVSMTLAELDALLQRFTHLTQLHLEGHVQPLTMLPEALTGLTYLQGLTLHDQGLLVGQQSLDLLARIESLRMLDLSGNRFDVIAQVPAPLASRIERLYLGNINLQQWPAWVEAFSELRLLGLDHNLISELPQHVLENPVSARPLLEVSLRDNPLTDASLRQAYHSEGNGRRYAFVMDLPDDLQAHLQDDASDTLSEHSPSSSHGSSGEEEGEDEVLGMHPWLLDTPEENQLHEQAWQALEQDEQGDRLLRLVERLRQSAPFRDSRLRPAFARRVWAVLQNAASDADERALYSAIAEEALLQDDGSQTCHDGAHLVFNQIELRLFNQQALRDIPQADQGPALYRLTRRLYRMQALDDIALARRNGRDEAEVRLAYRMRLAAELDLPVPPGGMLYEATAAVSALELSQVLSEVQQGEHGTAFLTYAANNEAWVNHLRRAYAVRFEQIESEYQQQVNGLTDRFPDQTLEQLGPMFATLEAEKNNREQGLIRELTHLASQSQESPT